MDSRAAGGERVRECIAGAFVHEGAVLFRMLDPTRAWSWPLRARHGVPTRVTLPDKVLDPGLPAHRARPPFVNETGLVRLHGGAGRLALHGPRAATTLRRRVEPNRTSRVPRVIVAAFARP